MQNLLLLSMVQWATCKTDKLAIRPNLSLNVNPGSRCEHFTMLFPSFGLHSHLITQLANQPGFGWNSCNIFFFFPFVPFAIEPKHCRHGQQDPEHNFQASM